MELTQFSMYVTENGRYNLMVEAPCKLNKDVQEDVEFLISLVNRISPQEISGMSVSDLLSSVISWNVNSDSRTTSGYTTVEIRLP